MRHTLATTLHRLARWLAPKAHGLRPAGSEATFLDAYKRLRSPSPHELLAELKNTAWTCASINAAVCASFRPRLFVATHAGQPRPKCLTRPLSPATENQLRQLGSLPARITKAAEIEEVLDHPLLTLFQQVNPVHNAHDLLELTTFYQEVHGSAYWHLRFGPFDIPEEIWTLPAQQVTPVRQAGSSRLVDYYEYRAGNQAQRFRPEEVIHFFYPDPRDPYRGGLGPLRACYESVALTSEYLAFKRAVVDNSAVPSAIVSPDGRLGEDERERLETQWNQAYGRGGAGRILVAERGLDVHVLSHSIGDLATLAEYRATKEDIANAFHVPLSFLTSETNLANLQAAEHQHLAKAIRPRLQRRDEKINEKLVPLFDPTGRLFVASGNPVPEDPEVRLKQQEADLKLGVITINEVRTQRGLPPAAWGDAPREY